MCNKAAQSDSHITFGTNKVDAVSGQRVYGQNYVSTRDSSAVQDPFLHVWHTLWDVINL